MDITSLSDAKLIERYLHENDDGALEVLIKRYTPRVYSLARQYTGDSHNASDITQETFVKAWKNLKKFDTERSFQAWIFTITKNTALDWLKRKTPVPFSAFGDRENESDILSILMDPTPSLAEVYDARAVSRSLRSAVQELPSTYQKIVLLRGMDGLTFNEIAERLQVPLNTVKSQYRRALLLLRKNIEKEKFK